MKLRMTRIPRKRQACRFAYWTHRVKDLQRLFAPHASKTSYPPCVSQQRAFVTRRMICRRRGVKKACQGESEKPAGLFAAQETPAQLFFLCSFSGRSRRMFSLSLLKSGCAVAAVARAHSEENPYPDIGQGTHGNCVAFALLSLALVVVSGPTCSLSTLPCELLECIAQRFAPCIASMRLGIVPTLKQDRRGKSQGLQTGSLSIAVRIIPNFSQQPRGKPFSSSG